MKYIAEIRIRTGAFEARNPEHARRIVEGLRSAVGIAYLGPDMAGQVVVVDVQETEEGES